jgi:hypothetical protein
MTHNLLINGHVTRGSEQLVQSLVILHNVDTISRTLKSNLVFSMCAFFVSI